MKNIKRVFLIPLAIASSVLLIYGVSHALSVFNPDQAPVGYVGMPAVTSNDIASGTSTMFSIDYSTLDWTGNVHAYPISSSGAISTTDNWSVSTTSGGTTTIAYGAAAVIDAQNWDTGRKIVTFDGAGAAKPFRWNSLAAGTQQADLGSQNMLNYIRGDRSNEDPNGAGFRARRVVLGDIVHSTPLYWEDPVTYSTNTTTGVVTATSSTNCSGAPCKTVFVGANDGMLHVLDANTGQERFAFIPGQLISSLDSLAALDYTHQYFVDGQMAIRTYGSKSVLVGTLGGGGQGVYALDISNPNPANETAAAGKLLWEITGAGSFANLGNVYGKPVLTKAQDGTPMVLLGNGYNNDGSGRASLYKINALTGALIGEMQTDNSGSTTDPNGLSTPTLVDVNLDGKADYAYAGDINGNLWKFDLTDTSANPAATLLMTTDLYASPSTQHQAITMAPAVMPHPKGGYMVVFVTGKLFTLDDQKDTSTHYAYGYWDDALAPSGSKSSTPMVSQAILTEYTYGTGSAAIRVRASSPSTDPVVDWTKAKGWKTALPIGGERLVGGDDALISQGIFRFLSSNPTVNTSTTVPGENWWMELNPLTGGASGVNRFDLNGDKAINDTDKLSLGTPAVLTPAVGRHMGGGVRSQLLTLFADGYAVYDANYDRNGAPPSPAGKGVAGGHFDVEFYKAPNSVCVGQAVGGGAIGQGNILFNYGSNNKATKLTIKVGSETVWTGSTTTGRKTKVGMTPTQLVTFLDTKGSTNYVLAASSSNSSTILVIAKSSGAVYNGAVTVTITTDGTSPGYVATDVAGGLDSTGTVTDATTQCDKTTHIHEYDDIYDKTGVNMLNPSNSSDKLSNAINSSQKFKVLMMNQYLSPAVMLNINRADYDPASATGYIYVKNYMTGGTLDTVRTYLNSGQMLDITSVPSYDLTTIKSLVVNMPVDAFDVRDWWGNADKRNGLHSSSPQCVYFGTVGGRGSLVNSPLADMYTPVVPPAAGVEGPGVLATTTTATSGARHNGALTVQIIKDTTPQSAIEQNVAGRPEFGYRVKQEYFFTYVLAEYGLFWHHPRRVCYHDESTQWYNGSSGGNGYPSAASGAWNTSTKMTGTGWTKTAPDDTTQAAASQTPANGSTDPKLGSFASIAGAIGSGSNSSGGNSSTDSSGALYNVVTGGRVVTSVAGSSGGPPATGTTPAGTVIPTMNDVYGLKGRAGRINWREIFK